jgi:hypothetical protein
MKRCDPPVRAAPDFTIQREGSDFSGALSVLFSAQTLTFVLILWTNVPVKSLNEVTFVLQFRDKRQMRSNSKADIVRSLSLMSSRTPTWGVRRKVNPDLLLHW